MPRVRSAVLATLLAPAALLSAPSDVRPQDPPPRPLAAAEHYRVVEFTPRTGPAGTLVNVSVRELPAITPVYLTVGGTGSGFEVLGGMLITNLSGELSETVRVPSWVTRDELHTFVVMDVYFRRLAASAPFHVTGFDGTVLRSGVVESVAGECAGLRGDDGQLYGVRGLPDPVREGERVVVEGRPADGGCAGDLVLRGVRVRRGPGG